ncbi:MAG: N-6 DNA methylase [Bacteroidetes bacterium]|nr:N-6 DNA methylase [Bacteroidota bacterium]
MTNIRTETETVIKKILPYLNRRGYDLEKDLDFETPITTTDRYSKGYVDILVTLGEPRPVFLIEAKKISKKLTNKDRDQAINYAVSPEIKAPFVVVTNGKDIQCFNVKTKKRILWDGKLIDKIPTKSQLRHAIKTLRADPEQSNISLSNDSSLPFRPGLPLRQLNALFYKIHSLIRKIEKSEQNAFADFSKLLFLKLLEEKYDTEEGFTLPYSYRFHELAIKPKTEADQVRDSILSMIESIKNRTQFGEVLEEKIKLKNPKTFHQIIKKLSEVSFQDCTLDSKGAAFEYFVRATLKGKKLGQYFTPRQLVQVMVALIGRKKVVNAILSGGRVKVLDPACGTGGFLVFLMQDCISQLQNKLNKREITNENYQYAVTRIKEETFYGSDANDGVAASAKMNMIIAGDGHTNIQHEDSLTKQASNWKIEDPDVSIILTNPPFGTSEGDSLTDNDLSQFPVSSTKGQYLFLQKMILTTVPGGEICTVIDEGVLNTESGKDLREFILQHCKLIAVVNLPDETFKPNKINVKSSLLYLVKRENPDLGFEDNYLVTFGKINSLGYYGSGEEIRGFDRGKFLQEIGENLLETTSSIRSGYNWHAYNIQIESLYNDPTYRFDYKYWDIEVRNSIKELKNNDQPQIRHLNQITTRRGKSPTADSYVDKADGHAIVIKAGSNVSKFGTVISEGADWVEKATYDEFVEKATKSGENYNLIEKGDVVLSSTGDGTLGKCCVYDLDFPAIGDGHVTIIRVDPNVIDPYYLADYLRKGFGASQVHRLFTGSTGMIELTPDHVDSIVIDKSIDLPYQKELSKKLREEEMKYVESIKIAEEQLLSSYFAFDSKSDSK